MNLGIDQLVSQLSSLFERRREKRQATIVGVERSEQSGRQGYVLAEIQRAENDSYVQRIFVGDASNFAVGDVKWVRGSGNPVDPDWVFGESIKSRNPVTGADVDKPIIVLTIPTEENPDDGFSNPVGVVTEEDQDSTTGVGVEQAMARVYYRTIVPGTHSVYDPSTYVTGVVLQYRRLIDENWRTMPSAAVWPDKAKRLRLVVGIDNNDLVASVSDDDGVPGDDWPIGHYVYWQLDGEVVLAKVSVTGAMTILERGVEGSDAVAHAADIPILLLTGMAVLFNLDANTNHEVRVSAQTGHNIVGPPSVTVAFVTWRRSSVPGLVDAQFSVDLHRNGYHLEWERPTDPESLLPMTARLRYRLYRNTSATTVGAKIVDEGHMGFAADIATTLWDTPATQADANWFGIEPYDSFGNLGTVLWEQDTVFSLNPSIDSWRLTEGEDVIRVSYTPTDDSNNVTIDPGWSHFALLRATSAAGANSTQVESFLSTVDHRPLLDRGYFYQIVSVDLSGNVTAPTNDDQHWRLGIPNIFTSFGIVNGNFQRPGPVRTVQGTSSAASAVITSSTALFTHHDIGELVKLTAAGSGGADYYGFIWEVTSETAIKVSPVVPAAVTNGVMVVGGLPAGWAMGVRTWSGTALPLTATYRPMLGVDRVEYLTAGGSDGNRALKITFEQSASSPRIVHFVQRVPRPFILSGGSGQAFLKGLLRINATISGATVNFLGVADTYEDQFGQTESFPGNTNVGGVAATADTVWHNYDAETDWMFDESRPASKSGIVRSGVSIQVLGTFATDVVVYVDSIRHEYTAS